jgi:hypothetical protein
MTFEISRSPSVEGHPTEKDVDSEMVRGGRIGFIGEFFVANRVAKTVRFQRGKS